MDRKYSTARKPNPADILRQALAGTPEPKTEWYDAAIELDRLHREREAQREAQRQADEEAANAPHTSAALLATARRGGASATTALNSADILRAALGGSPGTINGGNA
jgi:hypothetical protein